MNAIEAKQITKRFDDVKVLDSISLSIPQGEIFGFLGPNGSGKTTAVRVLNGVLESDSGSARIYGKDIKLESKEVHRLSGVVTETASSYENLTAAENLRFFGQIYDLSDSEIKERSESLLKSLGIYNDRDKKVKAYSTGMKKRLSLARAMLHRPKVLFLDEPTAGLDPESAKNVNLMIRKLAREEGATVFLCTHQLKYAEEICTLYGFINKGRLIGFGDFNKLLYEKDKSVYVEIRGSGVPESFNEFKILEKGIYRIPIKSDIDASNTIKQIFENGGTVYEAKQSHWNLEDLYFAYQRSESDEAASEGNDTKRR